MFSLCSGDWGVGRTTICRGPEQFYFAALGCKASATGNGNGKCQRKTLSWLPGREITARFYLGSLPKEDKLKDRKRENHGTYSFTLL